MSHKKWALAFGAIVAAAPVSAQGPKPAPTAAAPAAGPEARYCLRVDPATGSLVETVQCWTREQWADQGVDVDQEWAKEGVSVIDEGGRRERS